MASTHEMRYEGQDTKRSNWSWLLPLAGLALAAILLASYLARDNAPAADTNLNQGTQGTNNLPAAGLESF